jgi:2-dehydro-3-deoxygluconokinase
VSCDELRAVAAAADVVVITGITLALCSDNSFEELLLWVDQLPSHVIIVFDCNFRPALWESREIARARIERFRHAASLIVTSLDDETSLWPDAQLSAVLGRLIDVAAESILRAGKNGCWVRAGHEWTQVPTSAGRLVDPTGAGDSHLAGYIAARIDGWSPLEAARFANDVARVIVSQQGAILRGGSALPPLNQESFR